MAMGIGEGTDPLNGGDGDGLSDGDEVSLGSDPLNSDSDSDRLDDSEEMELALIPIFRR